MLENYFIFKKDGISYDSRDYGITCGSFPPIVVCNKKITTEKIPGRSGTLIYTDDSYESYPKSLECAKEFDTNTDLTWLFGQGKLTLSNELDKEYDVILKNNIELNQIATYYQNFILKFEVQPFKRSRVIHQLEYFEKEFSFNIGGTTLSFPVIKVTGSGLISITINEDTFQIKDLQTTITLDSELEVAIENGQNACFKIDGNFPKLKNGTNKFSIIGNVSKIEIQYQDTYL